MKIPALLTFLLAVLLAAVPLHRAQADEVNFDVFYNNLADDGDWYNTPEYGYVWQPYVAYKSDKWRPYSDGYWAQTDDGWTWVSYENFGWATYHYGRWTRLQDTGWVWVPGYEWGPGWVSWRTSDDYVGWAPLPPKVESGVTEGRLVDTRREQIDYNDVEQEDDGYGTNVDVQYDIGPANYCFVETRHFGAPVLSQVCLPPQQNVVFIERTTNVTNIYYRRDHNRTVVFNNGPDFVFINNHVDRPIPRLRLERHDDPGFLANGLRSGGNPTLVRDGILNVATPAIARRPVNFTQIKPTRIKQNIAQTQVAHGWSNSGADPAAVQRIREHYKQQAAAAPARPANPVIPPPAAERPDRPERAAGNTPPTPGGGAQPFEGRQPGAQPAGAPHGPLTEEERIARRDARQKERDQRATNAPAAPGAPNTAAQGANADQDREAKRAARQAARANGQPVPQAATPNPAPQGAPTEQDREAKRAARQAARANGQPAAQPEAPQANADQDKEAKRAARQAERANGQQPPAREANQGQSFNNGQAEGERANRQAPRQPAAEPQGNNAPTDQERDARRAARQQERANQPAPQQQAAPQAQQDQEARRAARQQERASQPAPQQQQQAAQPDQEARRAARQQERAAQQQPQPSQQSQGQGGNPNREGHGGGKPGQSPNP